MPPTDLSSPDNTPANLATRVISSFGSQSALARALGTTQSTVHYWARTGEIPPWRLNDIQRVAHERGIALDDSDFATAQPDAPRPAAPPQPQVLQHGRADPIPRTEYELADLREELRQLRDAVGQLVEEVRSLREERMQHRPSRRQKDRDS